MKAKKGIPNPPKQSLFKVISLPDNPVRLLQPTEAFIFSSTGKENAALLDEPACIDGNEDTECKITDGYLVIDYKINFIVHRVEIVSKKSCCEDASIIAFEGADKQILFQLLLADRVFNETQGHKLFEISPKKALNTWSTNLGCVRI